MVVEEEEKSNELRAMCSGKGKKVRDQQLVMLLVALGVEEERRR